MPDLSVGDQVADGARNILDRHARIDAVLIEEVDPLNSQPLQCGVTDGADVVRTAVGAAASGAPCAACINVETELRGDRHGVADRHQRLADKAFVREGPIGFGGVEMRDPQVMRGADQRDGLCLGQSIAVGRSQPHAAKADGRNGQSALPKRSLFHGRSPCLNLQQR